MLFTRISRSTQCGMNSLVAGVTSCEISMLRASRTAGVPLGAVSLSYVLRRTCSFFPSLSNNTFQSNMLEYSLSRAGQGWVLGRCRAHGWPLLWFVADGSRMAKERALFFVLSSALCLRYLSFLLCGHGALRKLVSGKKKKKHTHTHTAQEEILGVNCHGLPACYTAV